VKRRDFITLLGGAAAGWPLAARAQRLGRLPTIGFMGPSTRSVEGDRLAVFVQRLDQLGWNESRNIRIEYRWADARLERFTEIAAELVRDRSRRDCNSGAAPVLAAKRATSTIPIIFAVAVDPSASPRSASHKKLYTT
jgi:hypothetical protein